MSIQRLGGGGGSASFSPTVDTISADKAVTSSHPTFEDSGHSVTFTASSNENVILSYAGSAFNGSGSPATLVFAYKLDSDSDVQWGLARMDNSWNIDLNPSLVLSGLSSGEHTIKFRVATDAGEITLHGTTSNKPSQLSVMQLGS